MLDPQTTIVLCCSSLKKQIDRVQVELGTQLEVVQVNMKLHSEPGNMQQECLRLIEQLDPKYTTVLVSMGFCGGCWDHVQCDRQLVIPRADDCVSILLCNDDEPIPNRKEFGHLYVYEDNPDDFGVDYFMRSGSEQDIAPGMNADTLREMLYAGYNHLDIIDTGLNDCYSEEYVLAAQEVADQLNADLDYVFGSSHMLEKLLSGDWDDQFVVACPQQLIRHGDFF